MLSLIERGESSPTAVTLERVAAGLGVPLSSLFQVASEPASPHAEPLARREDQPEWMDPGSGYVRRTVTPMGVDHSMQIIEVRFPAGASVAFETPIGGSRAQQQVWILEGRLSVTVNDKTHELGEGDCLAMDLDHPIAFHNPTAGTTRYAVVVGHDGRPC